MKLLFITRAYPPLFGGMQRFANDFHDNLQKIAEVDLRANSGGNKALPVFIIKTLFFLMFNSNKYDTIHLYDAALSPLIPIIRLFSKTNISLTVNGLDIVYPNYAYQKVIPFFLKHADMIFAISVHTMKQCEFRGIPKGKLAVIPIGINLDCANDYSEPHRAEILKKFNFPSNKRILLTVGRLVKRKGHLWFIFNVFKELPESYIYIIAGIGPEHDAIEKLVRKLDLTDRIYLLGQISEKEKSCLYQLSDLFVMPNISVKGDQEGFGIVVLEAGRYGIPVIASNIEGIRDALIEGQTGHLVAERDARAFIDAIISTKIDRQSIMRAVVTTYNWEDIIRRYCAEFKKLSAT